MANERQKLPAWYYCVLRLTIQQDRDVYPDDFDEDLSSLSSRSTDSEASHNGSDADYYYELKEQRKERKLQLKEEMEADKPFKDRERAFDRDKARDVQETYDSLKNAEKQSKTSLDFIGGNFRLYCEDHVNYCYNFAYATKYVDFYYLDEKTCATPPLPPTPDAQMRGHVYLNSGSNDCDFGPFLPPEHAGLDEFELISFCKKYKLVFQFLNKDYLKLKLPREVVFADGNIPPDSPEVFEFAGKRYTLEMRIAEREKRMTELKRKRSPSPRETWFEMNHPMGYENQARIESAWQELGRTVRKKGWKF